MPRRLKRIRSILQTFSTDKSSIDRYANVNKNLWLEEKEKKSVETSEKSVWLQS